MNKIKTILLSVLATVCVGAVLFGGIACSRRVDASLCVQVEMVVADSLTRQYVDADALVGHLKTRQLYALGKAMSDVDCHAIEQALLQHPMLRTANCYKSPFGELRIRVTQRVPMLYVKNGQEVYAMDTDRKPMPYLPAMDSENLMRVTGTVSPRAVSEEYFDFALWLQDHAYWANRIKTICVHHPKHVVLQQKDYAANVVLGPLDGYPAKLRRLQNLYTKGFDQLGYPDCRELDLRFDGQVIKR